MIVIDHIETNGVTLYSEKDIESIASPSEQEKYKNTFAILRRINAKLGIERLPYIAYVDDLQGFDIWSEDMSSIIAEAITAEDYDIDNHAILINNDEIFVGDELEILLAHELRHVWQFSNLTKEQMILNKYDEWKERFVEVDAVAFELVYVAEVLKINVEKVYSERLTEEVKRRMKEV